MSDNLLSNIVILDVSSESVFFHYFIIATGMTSQHLQSSSASISRFLKDNDIKSSHKEGVSSGGWMLLDSPGITVHLFLETQRDRYGLEDFWSTSKEILRLI